MRDLFMHLINASFQGGVIIAAVVLLRLILKKAPKSILCLLWLLVIARLLLPFQLESSLSLQPDIEIITQQESQQPGVIIEMPKLPAHAAPSTTIKTDDGQLLHVELTYSNEDSTPEHFAAIDWVGLLPWLWLSVATALLGYSLFSYLKLRQMIRDAIILSEGVWLSPTLDTAFVLGFLRPQIYLPAKLTQAERQLVIAHERSHIARLDHWYKLLGYLALCIHWFNPLVWLAYILLCRDIELACDERVVKQMDVSQRKAYSSALLRCSTSSRRIAAYPVAFAEVSVKDRIKGVLNYKKPGFWITLASILAVVFVAVCFLTSPTTRDNPIDHTPSETTQTPLADYSEQELRQLCFDRLAEFQNAKYLHFSNHFFSNAGSEIRDYTSEYIQADNIFWGQNCYHHADNAKFAYICVVKENDMYECYGVKSYNPLTDESTWVQVEDPDTRSMYCGFAVGIDDRYLDNTTPMEVQRHDNGVDCIFTVNLSSDQTQTLTFQFDNAGSLTSMELHENYEDSETIQTVSIIPGTESEILQLADNLLEEVRKHVAYQQQVDDLKQELEEIQEEVKTQQTEP